jgi:hypothetical protein
MDGIIRTLAPGLLLACMSVSAEAQEVSGRAVIDGTQNPPQVLYSDVEFAISDAGTGSYTLTFETPVLFLLGTSMTQGPAFDANPTHLRAIMDSTDRRLVQVQTREIHADVDGVHTAQDAQFSLKFILESPLIFENGFE